MKMQHVTIQTPCLEESVKFYQDITGLTIQDDFRETVGAPMVFLSNAEGETCIELIENKKAPYKGDGISIGFHTDDVDAKYEELKAAGFELSPMIAPNPHVKFFFLKDPSGVTIQMI